MMYEQRCNNDMNYENMIVKRKDAIFKDANYKTKICDSIKNKIPCKHGVNCRFAHNLRELAVKNCEFEDKCHDKTKCCYKHKSESIEEFYMKLYLQVFNIDTTNN